MTVKRRAKRLRRRILEPGTNGERCAMTIVIFYAEPYGRERFGVQAEFITAPTSDVLGSGRTPGGALRDAERRLRNAARDVE